MDKAKMGIPMLGTLICLNLIFHIASSTLLPFPFTGYGKTSYITENDNWNFDFNPNLKISEEDLNRSISFGAGIIDRMHRLEMNLGRSDIHVKQGTSAQAQLIASNPEVQALEQQKYALIAAKATIQLMNTYCHQQHLSQKDCAKLLRNHNFQSTELNHICLNTTRCTSEEFESKFRKLDGSCNHQKDASWGQSFTSYRRLLFPDYLDGVHQPRRSMNKKQPLPSPRLISTTLVKYEEDEDLFTLALMQWSQFIEHDLAHTAISKMVHSGNSIECCSSSGSKLSPRYVHPFCAPISIPSNDKIYAKNNLQCMTYVRSVPALRPDCGLGPIEQLNQATHFLDGSQIYGNYFKKSEDLRAKHGGQLKSKEILGRMFLPNNPNVEACMGSSICFVAGDSRVNSQPQLTAMHTIWLREHNRIAKELSKLNPNWNDDRLFEESRRIVIAELQHITYYEFLPNILDEKHLTKIFSFGNFNDAIDPSIRNSFATAAFRFIKSLMPSKLSLYKKSREINATLNLRDVFYKPNIITEAGVLDGLIRGLTIQRSQKADFEYVPDVVNAMYGKIGLDIVSLDIQRGRDHGLPSYAAFRKLCGLPHATSFDDFGDFIPEKTIKLLKTVYKHPNDVDLLVGGLSEMSFDDSLLGPTFSYIIADQFSRTRSADRYFYTFKNQPMPFSKEQLSEIQKVSLARIFCDNGDDIESMQLNAFKSISIQNQLVECADISRMNLRKWIES